jgi:hypothetical protein
MQPKRKKKKKWKRAVQRGHENSKKSVAVVALGVVAAVVGLPLSLLLLVSRPWLLLRWRGKEMSLWRRPHKELQQ